MATALPTITDLTGSSVTEAQFKTQLTNLFAALRERGDPLGSSGYLQNLGLTFSVGSSALTCALKQRDGSTNADSTNAVAVPTRSATATSGAFNVRAVTAALSLVISSGSTLGHSSGAASYIYWYLIDNSGTLELAASTKYFGPHGIVSTTAEGGAGAADSATVMYSTTARSNVPFVCIGRTTDTQTTAGTWAAVPSLVELAPFEQVHSSLSTPAATTSTAQLATTAFVQQELGRNPAFSATKSGTQAVSADTLTKVTFETESYDTHNNFASSTFTPTVAGKYLLVFSFITTAASDQQFFSPRLYKNGALAHGINTYVSGASAQGHQITAIVDANGSSDYFEAYIYFGSTGRTIDAVAENTYFQGARIA